MRSLMIALALAAPVSAVAAAPALTYSNPMNTVHQQKAREVLLTFVNFTSQDREVRIGDVQYKIRYDSVLHVYVPVGSLVSVSSDMNSKVDPQYMYVSANDAGKSVLLR